MVPILTKEAFVQQFVLNRSACAEVTNGKSWVDQAFNTWAMIEAKEEEEAKELLDALEEAGLNQEMEL